MDGAHSECAYIHYVIGANTTQDLPKQEGVHDYGVFLVMVRA